MPKTNGGMSVGPIGATDLRVYFHVFQGRIKEFCKGRGRGIRRGSEGGGVPHPTVRRFFKIYVDHRAISCISFSRVFNVNQKERNEQGQAGGRFSK